MKVICPKCQFENQADPNASRVVCARCATIVDVGMGLDEGLGGGFSGSSGNYGNVGNNFGANYSGGYEQTIRPGAYPPPSQPSRPQLSEGDVYATRIDDDFDDVLDIPRPSPSVPNYQYNESAPAFDDVFASPSSYETMVDTRPPADNYQANPYQNPYQNNAYQEADYGSTQAYEQQPAYGAQPQETEFMGWPVLPEDTTDPGIPPSSAFSKSNNFLKIGLAVLAVGAVLLFGYSYLFGNKKPSTTKPPAATNTVEEPETTASNNKPADEENKPVGPSGTAPATTSQAQGAKAVVIPPVTTPAQSTTAPKPTATVLVPKETKVTPPPVETAKKEPTMSIPNKGNITIQAGSYNDQAQANERVRSLKAQNVDARVVAATIPGRGTWYRVQIGRFPSREQATSFANQLRSKGAVSEVLVTPVN